MTPRSLAFVVLFAAACGGTDELTPTLSNVESEVFAKSCNNFTSCHQGNNPPGNLNLVAPTFAKLMRASTQRPEMPLIDPGNPDNSYLLDKLLGRNIPAPFTSMPQGTRLDDARIDLVRRWIAAGANND